MYISHPWTLGRRGGVGELGCWPCGQDWIIWTYGRQFTEDEYGSNKEILGTTGLTVSENLSYC